MTFRTQCHALTTLSLERTHVPIQQEGMWSPEPAWTMCLSCILYFSSVSIMWHVFYYQLDTCVLIIMTHAHNLLFLCQPLYYCSDLSCMVILDQCHVVHYPIWQHTQVHGAAQWPHPSAACFLFSFMVPIQSAFHYFRNTAKAEEM
jgi:hypothetical protein